MTLGTNKGVRFRLHQYLEDRSNGILNQIGKRKVVYLDLNYWIRLRSGAEGADTKSKEFYDLVNRLHTSGTCIFPVSEIVFWELLKQEDILTRTATIHLVDRFSEGIAIANTEHCMLMEMACWINSLTGNNPQKAGRRVWSKINTVMSYSFSQTIPGEFMERFLDFTSGLSLEQVIADKLAHFRFKDDVAMLNTAVKAHAHENKTEQDMFLSEIGGMIAQHAVRINEANEYEYFKQTGKVLQDQPLEDTGPAFDKLLYHCFRTGKVTDQLPSLHIVARLHAWTRWIKKNFKDGNDTMDFLHAAVALPYADYFLTERRLTAGITAKALDKTYQCAVHWQHEDVIRQLQAMLADNL